MLARCKGVVTYLSLVTTARFLCQAIMRADLLGAAVERADTWYTASTLADFCHTAGHVQSSQSVRQVHRGVITVNASVSWWRTQTTAFVYVLNMARICCTVLLLLNGTRRVDHSVTAACSGARDMGAALLSGVARKRVTLHDY